MQVFGLVRNNLVKELGQIWMHLPKHFASVVLCKGPRQVETYDSVEGDGVDWVPPLQVVPCDAEDVEFWGKKFRRRVFTRKAYVVDESVHSVSIRLQFGLVLVTHGIVCLHSQAPISHRPCKLVNVQRFLSKKLTSLPCGHPPCRLHLPKARLRMCVTLSVQNC